MESPHSFHRFCKASNNSKNTEFFVIIFDHSIYVLFYISIEHDIDYLVAAVIISVVFDSFLYITYSIPGTLLIQCIL